MEIALVTKIVQNFQIPTSLSQIMTVEGGVSLITLVKQETVDQMILKNIT